MEKEIWKDVFDYPDEFMISNHGRVWSKRTNKILIQGTTKKGYKVISSKIGGRSGKYICKKVHRWVAEAFIDNPENKLFVNHVDCDKSNNYYKNLEWCTSKENTEHALKNGLINTRKGCDNPLSKLSQDDVNCIRSLYKPMCRENGARSLSKRYNVSHTTILDVVSNKRY